MCDSCCFKDVSPIVQFPLFIQFMLKGDTHMLLTSFGIEEGIELQHHFQTHADALI
jgi:hypothetical protein